MVGGAAALRGEWGGLGGSGEGGPPEWEDLGMGGMSGLGLGISVGLAGVTWVCQMWVFGGSGEC